MKEKQELKIKSSSRHYIITGVAYLIYSIILFLDFNKSSQEAGVYLVIILGLGFQLLYVVALFLFGFNVLKKNSIANLSLYTIDLAIIVGLLNTFYFSGLSEPYYLFYPMLLLGIIIYFGRILFLIGFVIALVDKFQSKK